MMDPPRGWSRGSPFVFDLNDGCWPGSESRWEFAYVGNRLKARARRRSPRRRDPMPYNVDLSGVLLSAPLTGPIGTEFLTAPHGATSGTPMDSESRGRAVLLAREASRVVVKTRSGWLVGFDGGVHGGSLWWFPAAPGNGRLLWPGTIRFLERLGTEVVALSGSGYPDGYAVALMLRLHPTAGWTVRLVASLPSEPTAILSDGDGRMYVGTRSGILEARRFGGVEPLLDFAFPDAPRALSRASRGDFAITFRSHALVMPFRPPPGRLHEWFWLPDCQHDAAGQ